MFLFEAFMKVQSKFFKEEQPWLPSNKTSLQPISKSCISINTLAHLALLFNNYYGSFVFLFFFFFNSITLSQFHVPEAVAERCSVKKGVLRNFANFTGKHLCQRLFFNEVAGLFAGCFSRLCLLLFWFFSQKCVSWEFQF